MRKGGWVYILANWTRTTLYIGVTSNLKKRIQQHKSKLHDNSFTAQYNCNRLVYYERFDSIVNAIDRETQLKKWQRNWKVELITKFNPDWKDLFDSLRDH